MPTMQQWLDEYGESHQNATNKTIHWICVPAIFFAITGLLYSIKLPFVITGHRLNIAVFALVAVEIYYYLHSKSVSVGMFVFAVICLLVCHIIELKSPVSLWLFSLIVFIVAWIGQFYGHRVEGKKPSFLKDLQFLLIGPAWLMSFIYQRLGIEI